MDVNTKDWKTWLIIAVTVLTALLNAVNGGIQTDTIEKKVNKITEKVETVEKDVTEIKTKGFTAVNKQ